MKTSPYWWEHIPRENTKPHSQPDRVDVAIIGAGYTGLSAALVMAKAGLSVAVFEAGQLGEGASSRNGGMLGPSFHKLGIAGLTARYGAERTNQILRESISFVDFMDGFLTQNNIEADFVRCGRFLGALRPKHLDAMAQRLESLQRACGVKGEMVAQKNQAAEIGSHQYCGGVVYHNDASLHPAKFHHGLVKSVRAADATILPFTPVQHLKKQSGEFVLTTPLGEVRAERVAICTNGYTGPQFPQFRRRILPLRSAMIATEELTPALMDRLLPKNRVYGDSRRIVAYYRSSPDRKRILFGSRAIGATDQPQKNQQNLHRSLVRTFPELCAVKVDFVWSGLVGYSFDHAPHIGQRDGLDYAMGYCGSGVARATYFGTKLGYKILGQTDAGQTDAVHPDAEHAEKGRTSFDDLDFMTKPLYTGNPWFMPAVLQWHKMLDGWGL